MDIKLVKKTPTATVPTYGTPGAAGLDLYADLIVDGVDQGPWIMSKRQRRLIPTNISVAIPEGYEGQIRPRSGRALKEGLTVLNSPGTIDSDYRGTIGVIAFNSSDEPINIRHGERIAQMVICPVQKVNLIEVDSLDDTTRADGGYGHTGK